MAGITLNPNEYVLAELNRVQEGRGLTKKTYKITLTNNRIIFIKMGTFGKDKVAFEKSISEVKKFNDAAQVKVTTVSGITTQIDIYLLSGQMSFTMLGAANSEALQFANELNHVVTGSDADIYSLTGNDTGANAFMKVFIGQTSAEAKKHQYQKIAIRCSGCGATFEGIKGKTSKCPYCGSVYNS